MAGCQFADQRLKPRATTIVGQIFGRVRAMFNDRGEPITEAGPATPVEVLGLQGVPQAGESFQVVSDITKAQSISQHRQMLSRQAALLQTTKRGIEALGESEVKELLVVIKADVQGSVEVLKSTLQKLSTDRVNSSSLLCSVLETVSTTCDSGWVNH